MKSLLLYLLQMIVASGLLYGYYHIALRNKKFHQYNRFFLLAAFVISILVPFINIPIYFTNLSRPGAFLHTLSVIYSSGPNESTGSISIAGGRPSPWWNLQTLLNFLYILIALLLIVRILLSLRRIRRIIKENPVERLDDIRFVNTNEPGTPYSFFRWLFWNRQINLNTEKGGQIFRHELFHIRQKHSRDILFTELVSAICWFNPFFHLMKKEIKAIHEFLADQFAINENQKWEYAELLLMQALNTKQKLVNPFFHNQIKRRIAMITNPQKTSHRYLRKILVLPVAAIIIGLFAFSYKKSEVLPEIHRSPKSFTVVIDAGHGGSDLGAISPDKKFTEAAISLSIARQVQKLGKEYNINVLMTRNDVQLPGKTDDKEEGLKNRIKIANNSNTDAFISIHVNSTEKDGDVNQTSYSGFEAYISGKREDAKGKLLGAALLNSIAPVYRTSMELRQRMTSGIYILDHGFYPAVMLECGYINNPEDLAFITDNANQEKIARRILDALVAYQSAAKSVISENTSSVNIDGKEVKTKDLKIVDRENEFARAAGIVMSKDTDLHNYLIVLDGKVQQASTFESLFPKPDTIQFESITILQGQEAIRKYGQRGKYGVLELRTKKKTDTRIEGVKLEEKPSTASLEKIFEKVEVEPAFPGGDTAWRNYLIKNVHATVPVDNGAPKGNYTVMLQFVVKEDGSLTDIKTLTHFGYGMEEEAIRLIKTGPNWNPGLQNGNKVNVYRLQPITFLISEEINNAPGKVKPKPGSTKS